MSRWAVCQRRETCILASHVEESDDSPRQNQALLAGLILQRNACRLLMLINKAIPFLECAGVEQFDEMLTLQLASVSGLQ